jgi:hypothetical protein
MGPPPAENQQFLRPEAALAIVVLTNQDDCSASSGQGPNGRIPLFDTVANQNMASQLGPPTHFRCNEFGHFCPRGGVPEIAPDRDAPNEDVNATVTYAECVSNDVQGFLLSTADTANRIKSLKADPSRAVVASIQGAPTPYTVQWTNPSPPDVSCKAASCPWPAITHSCTAADGRYGDPGVRTAQFAQEFGPNGMVGSVCDGSFAPSLERAATMINGLLGPACIPGEVGLNSVGQPDCKVSRLDWQGRNAPVPSCTDSGDLAPCWRLTTTAKCTGQTLEVSPDPSASSFPSTVFDYDCAK